MIDSSHHPKPLYLRWKIIHFTLLKKRLCSVIITTFCSLISLHNFSSVYSAPLTAFFYDINAFSADEDGNGGHDYVLVQFDVDLDEDVTANVTVIAELYNQTGKMVAAERVSYKVRGQEVGYNIIKLIPKPNVEGAYDVHVMLSDKSDEVYIEDVYYNPVPGNKPVAYFADVIASSKMDIINIQFDVNILQKTISSIVVKAVMINFHGQTIESQTLSYKTFFDNVDYQIMNFRPTIEDAYSIVLTVYPGEEGIAVDSRMIHVLWPPGTGAYFRKYDASIFNDRIELDFDVDLAYNITYAVLVEGILYNSDSDVVAYGYITYLTSGTSVDERILTLVPKALSHDRYYAELIVYVDSYPASRGYIEDIPFGRPRWDLNGDNTVDILDMSIVAREFGRTTSELGNPYADVNEDGIVDILDLVIVGFYFGESW